jgi:polyisoprenoid-binding protein YceI
MTTATLERTALPTGTWVADKAHTKIGFAVKHLGVTTVRGEFSDYDGELVIGEDLADARATATIKVASVDTGVEQRDDHLRSADFFDAENHPEIRFESKRFEPVDDDTFRVIGDLTIHGVTNEVELEAEVGGYVESGMQGEERIGLDVTGQLSRKDYEMKFNAALGSGNAVVADKVRLVLDIAAVKQD